MIFENRQEAGKRLVTELTDFRDEELIILALPKGGVPVGFAIAEMLHVPLEVVVAHKIALPNNSEFGIGALAEEDIEIVDKPAIKRLDISEEELDAIIQKEKKELLRKVSLYRNNKPLPLLKNKIILLIDDGLATGVTARAAIALVKKRKPKKIIFASPVCSYYTARKLKHLVDAVICGTTPINLVAVGQWYRDFAQVSDEEVVDLLERSKIKE